MLLLLLLLLLLGVQQLLSSREESDGKAIGDLCPKCKRLVRCADTKSSRSSVSLLTHSSPGSLHSRRVCKQQLLQLRQARSQAAQQQR
jgi:hypothetical protein